MTDRRAILSANDAFYKAFQGRDIRAMAEIWAASAAVTCIHPGWRPLFGREAVLGSWAAILAGREAPSIARVRPEVSVLGDTGYVLCYEVLDAVFLVATNIFVREAKVWRLVHHQAGAAPSPVATSDQAPDAPPTMQ